LARSFAGNANLVTADNAVSGIDTATHTVCYWHTRSTDAAGNNFTIGTLTANGPGNGNHLCYDGVFVTSGYRPRLSVRFSVTNGVWRATNDITNARHHIAFVYDRSSSSNVPTMYVDAASIAVTTTTAASGTAVTGDDTLKLGENAGGTEDLTGVLSHVVVSALAMTAAQVNRAKWWGRPQGGLESYLPLVTAKLVDDGASGETLTDTSTTLVALVAPAVRPSTALMGMEIGW
jgi:hypothetical protein